jgi:hypothetical protein
MRNSYKFEKIEKNRPLGRHWLRWNKNIITDTK